MRQRLRPRLSISIATSAIGAAVAAAALGAAPASAKTIDVFPGQSIQAAVNLANPGDVIAVHQGVYHGSVRIDKDDLTLRGAGTTPQGTVLNPKPSQGVHGRTGISVFHHTDQHGQPVLTRGTDVSGFRVEGFAQGGVVKDFAEAAVRAAGTASRMSPAAAS
jgi:pectin methylesterase-like acyl-CoA thioesterase